MKRVACQGCAGAFSHLAAKEVFPEASFLFFPTFEGALCALKEGTADRAVLPVENSEAGRVADCHILLPESGAFIVGEHFLRIEHHLLGVKGANVRDVKTVRSHVQALSQCAKTLARMGITPYPAANTAMAAKETAENADKSVGAVASETAAELYGLDVLKRNIEDSPNNTTRFLILSAEERLPDAKEKDVLTSFVFKVRNIPAALYKSLGGFATNGVNILRLESYVDPLHFVSAGFFADVEGHPASPAFKRAMNELAFFAEKIQILGTYPADPFRRTLNGKRE